MSIIALGKERDRRSLRSPYTYRMVRGDEGPSKDEMRSDAGNFFREHLDLGRQQRILTMPGARWTFERSFTMDDSRVYWVGIEHSRPIFDMAVEYMPGRNRVRTSERGEGIADFESVSSSRAIHCNVPVADFLAGLHPRASKPARRNWRCRFFGLTAAWLDLTGPLCGEIEAALPRLQCRFHMDRPTAPAVIAYMVGRERGNAGAGIEHTGSRAEWCMSLLNSCNRGRYRQMDVRRYRRDGGATMECLFALQERAA